MSAVVEFLKKTSSRNGFLRERYEEKNIPTDFSNLTVFMFFGDYRSLFVLSSLLLPVYKEKYKSSKYFILCSWPGFQGLFPYVDEYWSFQDESQIKKLYEASEGFKNKSDLNTIYFRNLNEFFRDVNDQKALKSYYDDGLKRTYVGNKIQRFLPFVPSSSILGKEFNRQLTIRSGYKVFLAPFVYCKQWGNGYAKNVKVKREFWTELIDNFLKNNFVPVVWQNSLTYDLSQDYLDKCLFVNDVDINKILSTMRATGCVLDVFNNISRLAIAARCPFLAVDERSRYNNLKEYEIDDICAEKLPKQYIFSFSAILTDGYPQNWNQDIIPNIMKRLEEFIPSLDRDQWPTTGESLDIVNYEDAIREIKKKKFGTKLLKINRD